MWVGCHLTVCGARYKTRQGLSYHLSHTHKGGRANCGGGGRSRGGGGGNSRAPTPPRADATPGYHQPPPPPQQQHPPFQPDALAGLAEFQDSYLGYLSAGHDTSPTGMIPPPSSHSRTQKHTLFFCITFLSHMYAVYGVYRMAHKKLPWL